MEWQQRQGATLRSTSSSGAVRVEVVHECTGDPNRPLVTTRRDTSVIWDAAARKCSIFH